MLSRLVPYASSGLALTGAFIVLTGARSCGAPGNASGDDEATCKVAADCEGLPHIECDGDWTCSEGQCAYKCGEPEPEPDPTLCFSDGDCGDGRVCSYDDGCQSQCWNVEGDAEFCMVACDGVCQEAPAPDKCSKDAECGDGRWCDYTECVGAACEGVCRDKTEPPPPPTECWYDSDCAAGQYCAYGTRWGGADPAFAPEAPCDCDANGDGDADADCACGGKAMPMTGTCQPKIDPPPAQCWSDWDCAPDQMCSFDQAGFAPEMPCDCPPGADCACGMPAPNGVCVPKVQTWCWSDFDCQAGEYCAFDQGWGGGADPAFAPCNCDADGDGKDDADCACAAPVAPAGVCTINPNLEQCNSDADCGPGATCACLSDPSCPMCDVCLFQCVPTTPVGCTSDGECGSDQVCQIDVCASCWYGAECPPCSGTCVDVQQPEYVCMADSDCKAGSFCQMQVCSSCVCEEGRDCDCQPQCYGTCQPQEPPPSGCLSDSDCADSDWCAPTPCPAIACAADGWCPPCYGQCISKEEPTACFSDSDCGAGQQCEFNAQDPACWDGWCFAPPAGQCVPVPEPTKCVVSGCSGEICADEAMASICTYSPWYQCLQLTQCGVQADGNCGWTPSKEFEACLASFGAKPLPMP